MTFRSSRDLSVLIEYSPRFHSLGIMNLTGESVRTAAGTKIRHFSPVSNIAQRNLAAPCLEELARRRAARRRSVSTEERRPTLEARNLPHRRSEDRCVPSQRLPQAA